ncbi:hypothetical protein PI124_g2453 [Phytophthora idaei]|nr:hypothetical protein PI126_g3148 [Phytophthora idaei]KAG3252968.1 hypothetical protein PI124_g2453 [Phytophthora idaei]
MTYPWPDDKTLSNVLNALTTRLAKQRKEDEGKREVDKQKVFFLCDGPSPARREQMVVFVSSNEDWMQKVVKDDCCLFMPMWTPDELQKAALVLNFALDDAVIDQRYSICGGVARQCLTLWEKSVAHAKDRMLEANAEITNGDDLQNLILGKMIRRTRHRLLQDEPDRADKGKRTIKLDSPFVRAKLEGRLLEKSYADREKLRKSLASVSEAASLCGWIFGCSLDKKIQNKDSYRWNPNA